MQIGFIGLGKMGFPMVTRLLDAGHQVVVWNRSKGRAKLATKRGAKAVTELDQLLEALTPPRVIWMMLPAGQPTNDMAKWLLSSLSPGDTVVDGANAYYLDTQHHSQRARQLKIGWIDVGVSGGPEGAANGACLMIGGMKKTVKSVWPIFQALAAPNAALHVGESGAGHFAKMVHNGIEYGMMQSIAEGFNLLLHSPFSYELPELARLYNNRSVIESRLLEWLAAGYDQFGPTLDQISGRVNHSGEGEWTVRTAESWGHPTPAIKAAFEFRVASHKKPSYTGKVLSLMRGMFGGHDMTNKP